jgi:hypothetical protein
MTLSQPAAENRSGTSLTDRYVDATLHRLPARQRPDIERELRAAILDAVDDRVGAGTPPAEAERAVLAGLGDPAVLAAGYADRPLHLIGPALYLDYLRLLTALLATVVPAVAAAVGVTSALNDGTWSSVLGDTVGAAVTTAVHIAVWTTLVFAAIERVPALRWAPARPWSLDDLAAPPVRPVRFGELIAQAVLLVLCTTAVLVSPVMSTETDAGGRPIGLLSPWLWETGTVYAVIALGVVTLAFSVARRYLSWNVPLAVATSAVRLAGAAALLGLVAGDRLLNPAFTAAADWPPTATRWAGTALSVLAAIAIAYTLIEAAIGLLTRSWPMPPLGVRIRIAVSGLAGIRTR